MNEFTINVVQDPSKIININNLDQAVSLSVIQDQETLIQVQDDINNVLLNPSVFYNGINIVYLSGVSGELLHNTFGDLQGGTTGQYYHLSSGQYFNLITGTGSFYPNNNPSGFITGVDLSPYATITYVTGISGQLQAQITVLNNQTGSYVLNSETGQFYLNNNPSGYITGIDLSNYATADYVTGVSGSLQNQIINLNNQTGSYYPRTNPSGYTTTGYVTGISGSLQTQIATLNNAAGSYVLNSQTGVFYPRTNPSGYITGVDLSFSGNYYTKDESESRYVNTTGAETILGNKTFHDDVYINNLSVSGNLTVDTNTLVVDGVNNRVGVRTLTPAYPLDVVGIGQFSEYVLANGGLYFSNINVRIARSSDRMVMRGYSGFGFETYNGINISERMAIDSDGNLGIGTTSPSARLHTISTTEQVRFGYDVSNYWNATTSSTGVTTLSAAGSGAKFVFANDVEFGANATIPDVIGNTSFADDVEVLGELTVAGQPPLSALSDNHVITKGLSDEEYGWIDLPAGFANFSSTGGTVANIVIGVSIDTVATTASFSTARARFAGLFNRSPLAWVGGSARDIPFASRRTRLRAIIDKLILTGNAYFWFGVWDKNSLTATTDEFDNRGFGAKITPTQLIAQTHNGTTLFQSSPSSLVLSNSVLLEVDYYQQNLSVKVNGQEIASVSGGYNIDSAAQIHLYGYAPSGGVAGDQARIELKQLRYRITEN